MRNREIHCRWWLCVCCKRSLVIFSAKSASTISLASFFSVAPECVCVCVCDLFSGQMITVSAETGIENKMTCLETRKGGVSSLQPWQATDLFVESKGSKEEEYGIDRSSDREEKWLCICELLGKCVYCNLLWPQLLVSAAQPVLCVHVCVSLSLSHRECPEACWGRQAYPRWDDSDLSPTSDFLPCSANCTVTKLDSSSQWSTR